MNHVFLLFIFSSHVKGIECSCYLILIYILIVIPAKLVLECFNRGAGIQGKLKQTGLPLRWE